MESKKIQRTFNARSTSVDARSGNSIALKDWHIVQNDIDVKIKAGEPVPELPAHLVEALKTEKVI